MTWLLRGEQVNEGPADVLPTAPPGRYYIAPGTFHARDIQLGLLDAIRAGVDLSDSGIPVIEIREGEVASLTVDAVEAAEAIERVMAAMDVEESDDEDEETAVQPPTDASAAE